LQLAYRARRKPYSACATFESLGKGLTSEWR
jgi:hypothetical protein